MQNKNILKTIVAVLLSCIALLWVFNNYINQNNREKDEQIIDSYLSELTSIVDKNKNLVLTASVLLAKDSSIKKCLRTNNRCNCLKYLTKSKDDLLNTYIFDDFKIHVHDKNLRSFYRLWSKSKDNDNLESFRHSLKIVKEEKKSISTIEIGRYSMLIRGISPIIENGEYLGSIEAITNFNSITKYFEKKGINLYILMDKNYKTTASKVNFDKSQILTNYVILNKTNDDISFLKDMKFKHTHYEKIDYFYLVNTPIYDISRNVLGYYVMKIYL